MPVYSAEGAPLFSEGSGGSLRLLAYLAIAAALMAVDLRTGLLHQARIAASAVISPLQTIATAPLRIAKSVREATAQRTGLVLENADLRKQLLFAQAKLDRLAIVQEQNNHLRALLDARQKLGLNVQLAELIDVDLDPYRHRILINQGSMHGVFVGEAVIDAKGLIGQVLNVEQERATVILLSDPSHAVPVRVQRTGLRVIAYGSGDPMRVELPHVPFSADIKVGDLLVTSGIGGRFPPGLPVATVYKVETDNSATFAVAEARPLAGIANSSELLLVSDEALALTPLPAPEAEFVGPPEGLANDAPMEPVP
ncbi:MAG: rod shape-determining protein MreC [Rhodanobacteraceae bacterium]|nr:rod shape-determining protein MreC [Rhodanobacteraceae bacterium]MBK7044150.1 rod shape-determining protein MreC [Rhodanobacteraceae bacterium]MBP9154402.1 rod shape-determining protein MreC [Xanthomonadales bacterium]HQW81599.1 rod shape-determining protein MreC [Pseudomonadota bacterium]